MRRAGVEHERLARGGVAHRREQLLCLQAVCRQLCDEPDRLTFVHSECLELLGAEPSREQRVVAELSMGVERQVVGGERDVGVEQDLQPSPQRHVDRLGTRAPEEAVVHEQQISILGCRQLEQLGVRRDARREHLDVARAGDLQPVDAVVVEALGLEQPIDLCENLGERGSHGQRDDSGVEYWLARRGVAQPGSAHRSGR